MMGDNAKVLNPEPKPIRQRKQRARVDVALNLVEGLVTAARTEPHAGKVEHLRAVLRAVLLCLPAEVSETKKAALSQAFLESAYNDADEFYDMPHIEIDNDLVNIRGNFSLRKLAKKLQW